MYSEADFQKLQEQLIILKEDNYKLIDACKKYEHENVYLKQELHHSNQELEKCLKTVDKYKKTKDLTQLIHENESLHIKIQSQEEEFKLQNGTIMGELQKVLSSNESLEIENKQLQIQCQGFMKLSKSNNTNVMPQSNANTNFVNINASLHSQDIQQQLQESFEIINKLKQNILLKNNENFLCDNNIQDPLLNTLPQFSINVHSQTLDILEQNLSKILASVKQSLDENQTIKKSDKEPCPDGGNTKTQQINSQNDREKYFKLVRDLSEKMSKIEVENQKSMILEKLDSLSYKVLGFTSTITQISTIYERLHKYRDEFIKMKSEILTLNSQLKEKENLIGDFQERAIEMENQNSKCHTEIERLMEEQNSNLDVANTELTLLREKAEKFDEILADKEKLGKDLLQITVQLELTERDLIAMKDENVRSLAMLEHDKSSLERSYMEKLEKMKLSDDSDIEAKEGEIAVLKDELHNLKKQLSALNTELGDSKEDLKICEKKFVMQVKDVKRQLMLEKKRGEKLQEKFQEYLSVGHQMNAVKSNTPPENVVNSPSGFISPSPYLSDEDRNSVSSWSLVSSGTRNPENGRISINGISNPNAQYPGNRPQNPDPHRNGSSPVSDSNALATRLDGETVDLIGRLAALQTDKWVLEEKVKYLEDSASSLANELVNKNALIEHYVMGRNGDVQNNTVPNFTLSKSTSGFDLNEPLKKISEFVKEVKGGMTSLPGHHEDVIKTNRRLKVMLEETLTKNMMLQKDMEKLSNEFTTLKNLQSAQMDEEIGDEFSAQTYHGDAYTVENSYYNLNLDQEECPPVGQFGDDNSISAVKCPQNNNDKYLL